MKTHVRIATKDDADRIFELRVKEYQRSTDDFEKKNAEFLKWDRTDDREIVLAVFDEGNTPISTMSGIFIENREQAENVFEIKISEPILFPALILRRAATNDYHRRSGLNTLLRYYFIKSAAQYSIKTILGFIWADSHRFNTMHDIGYSFVNYGLVDEPDFTNKRDQLLATLPNTCFAFALQQLDTIIKEAGEQYSFTGREINWGK